MINDFVNFVIIKDFNSKRGCEKKMNKLISNCPISWSTYLVSIVLKNWSEEYSWGHYI